MIVHEKSEHILRRWNYVRKIKSYESFFGVCQYDYVFDGNNTVPLKSRLLFSKFKLINHNKKLINPNLAIANNKKVILVYTFLYIFKFFVETNSFCCIYVTRDVF